MELFKVRLEDKHGDLKTLLILADDAMQAYDFVERPDQFVYDITRQNVKAIPVGTFDGRSDGPITL